MTLEEAKAKAVAFLTRRQRAYQQTFLSPIGKQVLADLAKFCRAHETTFHMDARAHAVAEGRREVFLRIASHCKLSMEDLYRLYGKERDL